LAAIKGFCVFFNWQLAAVCGIYHFFAGEKEEKG